MDKIEVSQRAREKAWAVRPGCYCEQDRTKWMAGVYDHVRIIQAFARFERDILATRTDATPVAWMYEHPDRECGGTEIWPERHEYGDGWTETPIYTHPPATDVAALVEAAKDALPFMTQLRAGICLKTDGKIVSADSAYQNLYAALAPFTKG